MTKDQITKFLLSTSPEVLLKTANEVRVQYCGKVVYIRGLVEFSNHCCRQCLYCGLRAENKTLQRYRMTHDEIMETVCRIAKDSIGTVVLQSGDDFSYTRNDISTLVRDIKREFPHMAVTLSIGERSLDDYQAFRDNGADRYLLKHETINEKLYACLHPGQELKDRLMRLDHLRKLGYQVGIGNIVGLPGQTIQDLVDDILFIQDFQPDMIGISPFISQNDTPLRDMVSPDLSLVLRCIALARIVTKNAHIPSATAVNTLDPDRGDALALTSGANVLMVSYTPIRNRPHYQIYSGKKSLELDRALEMISAVGCKACLKRGDSLKYSQETENVHTAVGNPAPKIPSA